MTQPHDNPGRALAPGARTFLSAATADYREAPEKSQTTANSRVAADRNVRAPAPVCGGLSRGRLIKRRLALQPAFHQTDMMGVVHNSVYFLWFEEGRLQILLEVLPLEEALQLGVVMPVVENHCHYRKPVRFGCPLLLYTTHHIQPAYQGRLLFHHYLIHEKQRTAMAYGHTVTTLVDARSNRLIKEWPAEIWKRYQALA